ncbi:MAG: ABC transporter permease [Vicinamibacterales bacterium]
MSAADSIDLVRRELRHALRTLRKNPGFSTAAILCLALGVAVNTTMFSVINAVLLRAVPYPDAGRLVRLVHQHSGGDVTIAEFEFVKDHGRTFASIAAYRGGGERRLDTGRTQTWVSVLAVSDDFLRTLRKQPALGREFTAGEARAGGPQAIVISDSVWRTTFSGAPQVLGRTATLNSAAYTIVGVLPADFWFPQPVDVLVPLQPSGSLSDLGTNTQIIARLRDDMTLAWAQNDVGSMSDDLRRAQGGNVSRNYRGLSVLSYHDWLVGSVRLNLMLLFGATGLLLLISCANVAMLLLARTAGRAREIAVRVALGGSRQLIIQFLTENLVLVGLGAAAGALAAYGLVGGFVAWVPFDLPTAAAIEVDRPALAFTVVMAAGTALVVTLVPLFASRRLDVQACLRSERHVGAPAVLARTRNLLVVSEVALSTTLLIASGLMLQSLYRLHQERLGFSPEGLITFETPFAPERARDAADTLNFTHALLERIEQLPGVRGAAATTLLPLTGQSNLPTEHDGHPEHSIGGMEVRPVTPAYFDVMGIPLKRGRWFVPADAAASLPVIIVNETVARSWWPGADPLGDRVTIGRFRGKGLFKDVSREVVGVVADTKSVTLQAPPRPTVYVPMTAAFGGSSLSWVVKVAGAADFAAQLRSAVDQIDASQRIRRLRTMHEIVAGTSAAPRFNATLFGSFAGMALVLAALGVYGVLSFLVEQRRQEIGTRMALGASRGDVLAVFMRQGLTLTVLGLVIGAAGALVTSRWLSSLLFGVRASDPWSFAAVSLLLLIVAGAASYLPARRAARLDPMVAMRAE